MARWGIVFSLAVLGLGCTSSLTFEGFEDLEDFGSVGSAIWLEEPWKQITYGDWTSDNAHSVLVSPEPGMCDAYLDAYEAYSEAEKELDAAFSGEAQLEAWQGMFAALSEHLGRYRTEGSILVNIWIGDDDGKPRLGEIPLGETEGICARARVDRYTEDMYDAIASELQLLGGEFTMFDLTCLWYPENCDTHSDAYWGETGSIHVSLEGSERTKVEIDTELFEMWSDSPAGSLSGTIQARRCPLEID